MKKRKIGIITKALGATGFLMVGILDMINHEIKDSVVWFLLAAVWFYLIITECCRNIFSVEDDEQS